MYFKQIEMTGFKSFADRTVVRLEPGVTGIVGPNGCGKSNILDALRWSLGEQRVKELRGSHMQDVIFNGSDTRHASGMAEVSVTFDNADSKLPVDFSEVEISRRIYRSGESEYLINRAPCLLRDIQELFMDTGVGTQAYSLVGQGKMDLILSSKPEDRRFLFEEAAGIIKYKTRKRIAVRRLESAEQNLLRLGDIIAEVQRQMRSLKRQVSAAIRYRELSAQLRDLEIRSAWVQHGKLTREIADLRRRFAKSGDRFEGLSAQIAGMEARREELGLTNLELDRLLLERRETVHEIEAEMEKIERSIALLRQQNEFSKEQQQKALVEQDAHNQRARDLESEIERTVAVAAEGRQDLESCVAALEAEQVEHSAAAETLAQAEAHVEGLRARAVEKMNSRARTTTEVETLRVSIRNADDQLGALAGRQAASARRHEELSALSETTQRAQGESQQALDELTGRRTRTMQDQTARTEARRQMEDLWQAAREKKSSIEARLRSLRELRDTYEGYAGGVRAVMSAKNEPAAGLRGILGPAGDLLSTEGPYERAIEAALGGNINNIVVEDADAAKAAIAFLKEQRAGRVTFLPLDIIRGGRPDQSGSWKGQPGVVGLALDFVRFEPQLQNAVEYLLQGTLVVETLDDAIRIAREERSYPRLVTLEGEVVSSAGAVTGGRMRHESRGLLGRSAEIAELEEQVDSIEGETARLAAERGALENETQSAVAELQDIEGQVAEAQRRVNELHVESARHAAELETVMQSMSNIERERADLAGQRERLMAQLHEASARADSLESDDEAFQVEVAEAQESGARTRDALALCAAELADLRVREAGLAQRLDEIERDRERQRREQTQAREDAERRGQLAEQFQAQQAALERETAADVQRVRTLADAKDEAREKVVEAENQRQTVLDETDAIERELREAREEARSSQAEVHQLELDLRQREDRLGFFQERMLAEYNIALTSLREDEVGTDEYEDEQREQLVGDLRMRLQRMGEVNLMAIEEYEELEKRNNFLVTQADDLNQARQALLDVIERSDKRIRAMFLETFNTVGDHFRNYFRRLFNGGQARIYLLDEGDPLESGIEIEARPPGKKPQSISLLSGGESAMTAIALLFSIFKAKPSPFCILDEVDAPLDDANIGRFLSLLEEFTAESQFIVITHNKSTMARADALYGVTMQERGVSQLVSVKFNEPAVEDSAA